MKRKQPYPTKRQFAAMDRRIAKMPHFPHKFFGLKFAVTSGMGPKGIIGACSEREDRKRYLLAHPMLTGKLMLQTLVHEALHACFGKRLGEKDVERAGLDVGAFLFRYGYRLKRLG